MNQGINVQLIINSLRNVHSTSKKQPNTNNHKTKIQLYDFFSINEVKICNRINKLPYFANYFEIVTNHSLIKVGEMSEVVFEQIVNKDTAINDIYLLLEYNTKNKAKMPDLNMFLFNLPSPKLFVFHILDSYAYLLESLIQLSNKKVCFLDLCPENIIFNANYKPLLQNFQLSLLCDTLNEEYITHIITKIKDYTHKPLEIHLLFYLIANTEVSMSYSLMETICTNYMNNMSVLDFFSQKYRDSYKNACEDFLKQYINRPKTEIIRELLTYHDKWDNYSLSVIYLHIVGHISQVFSLKDTFINKMAIHLSKNLHPNPLLRETLSNSKEMFELMFNEYTDWSFISDISCKKLNNLYEIL
jgi:hypothetical protein